MIDFYTFIGLFTVGGIVIGYLFFRKYLGLPLTDSKCITHLEGEFCEYCQG